MTFGSIMELLREYAIIGMILAVIFAVGVWIIQKKMKKKFNFRRVAAISLFVCYSAIVLYATLLGRGSWYGGSVNLELFSSYKQAWYQFSKTEWRNLILNILLFVPMGFLLPVVFRKEDRFWKVYLTGFLVSVGIEFIQFFGKRGVVEADDVFNNTLGTMIGYGAWSVVFLIASAICDRNPRGEKCIVLQLPFLLSIAAFAVIFIGYGRQPFGNLMAGYSNGTKNARLVDGLKLSTEAPELFVYKLPVGTKEELEEYANQILKPVGQKVDPAWNDEYDETIVFRSEDQEHSVWIDYKGMTSTYYDFSVMDEEKAYGWSRDEVMALTETYGIEIPEKAEFSKQEDGTYLFSADQIENENGIWDGSFTCTITEGGKIEDYSNNLYYAKAYASARCLSEQDAYEQVRQGKFYMADSLRGKELVLESVSLGYEMDSKGYYQPEYVFGVQGQDTQIVVPAWVN